MSKFDDKLFEQVLNAAFNEQYSEELKYQPTMEELEKLHPFTEKHMKDAKRLSLRNRKPIWTKYIGKAAAILLCVSLAGFGVMLTDPGIRATVGENIVKCIEEGFNIDFTEVHDDTDIDISKTCIGYIPDGYILKEDRSDGESVSRIYLNGSGECIIIDILASSDIELMTDNNNHNVENHNINGYNGFISYSEDMRQGSVYFGNSCFTVAISGMAEKSELIKIAENIVIKE